MDVSFVKEKEVCNFKDEREGQNTLAGVKVTASEKARLRLSEQKKIQSQMSQKEYKIFTRFILTSGGSQSLSSFVKERPLAQEAQSEMSREASPSSHSLGPPGSSTSLLISHSINCNSSK